MPKQITTTPIDPLQDRLAGLFAVAGAVAAKELEPYRLARARAAQSGAQSKPLDFHLPRGDIGQGHAELAWQLGNGWN